MSISIRSINSEERKEEEDMFDGNRSFDLTGEDVLGFIEDTEPGRRVSTTSQAASFADEYDTNIGQNRVLHGLKWTVIGFLVAAGTVVASTAFVYSRQQEQTQFKEAFEDDARRFVSAFYERHTNKIWAALSLNGALTATAKYNDIAEWPYVTLPEYDQQTAAHVHTAKTDSFLFAPLLKDIQQRTTWEMYAVENQELAGIVGNAFHNRSVGQGVFRLGENFTVEDDSQSIFGISAPIWQASPPEEKRHLNMLNLFSIQMLQRTLRIVINTRIPQFSDFLDDEMASFFKGEFVQGSRPRSMFFSPVLNERGGKEVTGIIGAELDWLSYFSGVVEDGPPTTIVLRNTCSQTHTFEVRDGIAEYIGVGDRHDTQYSHMNNGSTQAGFQEYVQDQFFSGSSRVTIFPDQNKTVENLKNQTFLDETGICAYSFDIYPTEEYQETFATPIPLIYTLVTVALFILVIILFYIYDKLVERRQRQVMVSAAKSNAIIQSLFPAGFREKLFGSNESADQIARRGKAKARRQSITSRRSTLTSLNGDLTPKIRLANFLTSTSISGDSLADATSNDEPIAEMFSNTTVMFADIAGFTAWSSEREPCQVFKLLETLYSAFDAIAKRLGVFKVETIGDCYVAVTGLPDPNKDHALVCAQFSYQCLLAMNQLTHQLEMTLGPGTSELSLRIGLHSGAVTAGVLRGEKSRFQLFGDTMNTASRMESTGIAGKIQVSQETADLIHRAGRDHWLTQRNGTVTAKGKGEMQTYWVKLGRRSTESSNTQEQARNSVHSNSLDSCPEEDMRPSLQFCLNERQESRLSFALSEHTPTEDPSRLWGSVDESVSSRISARGDRLVDWNVEVLMGFLEKVVQHRLDTNTHINRWEKPSTDHVGLIIDEVAEVIDLPDFAASSRTKRSSRMAKHLPTIVRSQLKEFVTCIASTYREVPFHNFEHASHVTMSANKLMKRIITPDGHVDGSNKRLPPAEFYGSTFGISSDPITQFSVVFAALIHDVDHTGLSNSTLVEKGFGVARIFENKSVAEQNSVVIAWELLMEPRFTALQTCIFHDDHGRRRFRQLVVNSVMATDIMDRDMLQLRKNRWEKAFDSPELNVSGQGKQDMNRKATIVIEHIIQASDVAHTMQHWHIYLRWNARLYNELYRSFKLGYTDKDPTDGWYEGEIGFFDHYVIPLAKKLKECGVFGVSGDEYLQYAQWNRQEWELKGREETSKMLAQREEAYE